MAIKGSLKEASLPDVLQLLVDGEEDAAVSRVTHRNNFGYIYFDKGRICYASIVNRRDRLGDILVKAGSITQAQLDAAIAAQAAHRDKRLGELLVAQGAITRDAAARADPRCRSRRRCTSCSPGSRGRSTSRRTSRPRSRTSSSRSIPSRCCSRARGASTSGA